MQRELFAMVLAPSWPHGVDAAIDTVLLSRFYERFADHGVAIAHRMVFFASITAAGGLKSVVPQLTPEPSTRTAPYHG
jgi:phosphate uptake regulator